MQKTLALVLLFLAGFAHAEPDAGQLQKMLARACPAFMKYDKEIVVEEVAAGQKNGEAFAAVRCGKSGVSPSGLLVGTSTEKAVNMSFVESERAVEK